MRQKPPEGRTSAAMRQAERMAHPQSQVNADGSVRRPPLSRPKEQVPGQTDIYDQILTADGDDTFFYES